MPNNKNNTNVLLYFFSEIQQDNKKGTTAMYNNMDNSHIILDNVYKIKYYII